MDKDYKDSDKDQKYSGKYSINPFRTSDSTRKEVTANNINVFTSTTSPLTSSSDDEAIKKEYFEEKGYNLYWNVCMNVCYKYIVHIALYKIRGTSNKIDKKWPFQNTINDLKANNTLLHTCL